MGGLAKVSGNLVSALVLLSGDLVVSLVSWAARGLAGVIDRICGSGENTAWRKRLWHAPRYNSTPVYETETGVLDVNATLASSSFPIAPAALVEKAKAVMESEFGTTPGNDGSCLAEDFQFVAPIVGP